MRKSSNSLAAGFARGKGFRQFYGGLAVAASLTAASSAHAALVFDQVNLAPTDQGYLVASGVNVGNRQVQTVTAGLTGTLALVDLQVWGINDLGDLRVSLYDGDYTDATAGPSPGGLGVLVGSLTRSIGALPTQLQAQAGSLAVFDFSSFDYQLAPGQVFSVLLEVTDPNGFVGDVFGHVPDPSDPNTIVGLFYSGGYDAATFFGPSFITAVSDRGFATIVDVGQIPEPATWALMIGGLGLTGAALRSKRRPLAQFS